MPRPGPPMTNRMFAGIGFSLISGRVFGMLYLYLCKEDMALWMLRRNSPIEEISLITRLDRQRISEIADSAGFQAAAM